MNARVGMAYRNIPKQKESRHIWVKKKKTFSIFVSLVNAKYENICVPMTLPSLTIEMVIFCTVNDKFSSSVLALLPSSTYNYF